MGASVLGASPGAWLEGLWAPPPGKVPGHNPNLPPHQSLSCLPLFKNSDLKFLIVEQEALRFHLAPGHANSTAAEFPSGHGPPRDSPPGPPPAPLLHTQDDTQSSASLGPAGWVPASLPTSPPLAPAVVPPAPQVPPSVSGSWSWLSPPPGEPFPQTSTSQLPLPSDWPATAAVRSRAICPTASSLRKPSPGLRVSGLPPPTHPSHSECPQQESRVTVGLGYGSPAPPPPDTAGPAHSAPRTAAE